MPKKPMWFLTQQEIASATGLSQPFIHLLLNGDRQVLEKTALKMESVTGVCREAWMWPDRHWNPYMPFTTGENCMVCNNRGTRTRWMMNRMVEMIEAEPEGQRLYALRDTLRQGHDAMGFPEEVSFSFSIRRHDDYLVVGSTGWMEDKWPTPRAIPSLIYPYAQWLLRRGEPVIAYDTLAYFAEHLEDLATIKYFHIAKGFAVPMGRVVLDTLVRCNGPDYRFGTAVVIAAGQAAGRFEVALGGELDDSFLRSFLKKF